MFLFDDLQNLLHVEQLDRFLFRGCNLKIALPRVFGGQVLAQALNAAYRSVPDHLRPHSLHAYFLRPGDPTKQIIYEVDPIRDGRSFSTRRIVAKQNGEAIFNSSISFHKQEDGLSHQMDLPKGIPTPEELGSDYDYYRERLSKAEDLAQWVFMPEAVIDMRSHKRRDLLEPEAASSDHGFWFRFKQDVKDDPITHMTILAFISDKSLMSTGLRPHPVNFYTHKIIGASLDHAMWFHTNINLNQWIYYHMDSPRAAGARDFNRGSFYTQSGELIASTAQEGLIRVVGEKAT